MNEVAETFQEPDPHFYSHNHAPNSLDVSPDSDHGTGDINERPNPDHLSFPAYDSRGIQATGHYREW